MRRNFWLKLLIALNLSILVYLAFHTFGKTKIGADPSNGGSSKDQGADTNSGKSILRQIFNVVHSSFDNPKQPPEKQKVVEQTTEKRDSKVIQSPEKVIPISEKNLQKLLQNVSSTISQNIPQPQTSPVEIPPQTEAKQVRPATHYINPHIHCSEKDMGPRVEQRSGNYWVFYNYIRAEKKFLCNETITYTTHGEYTFLHNTEPLLKRWQGPMSVSIFTPGDDYVTALKAIYYYRECMNTTLIKDLVTFHFYFPFSHMPNSSVLTQQELLSYKANCDSPPAVIEDKVSTYRNSSSLDYPVNVGRNVAREAANSHFIFPSDIELYPNPGLIPAFLDMIRRNEKHLKRPNPRVFVSSIFEIKENTELPNSKSELIPLLKKNVVIPFHKKVCSQCHAIPKSKEWAKAPVRGRERMNVFHVAKRTPPYSHWEPIYIGTNSDPYYDERLSWEGRSDKMTQGYQLCVLNYDFMILDNAFLVHRPGIKTKADNLSQTQKAKVSAQNSLISKTIMPELKKLYGVRKGCEK